MLEALSSSPIALTVTLFVVAVSVLVWLGVRYDRGQQKKAVEGIINKPPRHQAMFENMPNFRQAGGTPLHNRYGQRVRDGLLFRSSQTDSLTDEELNRFLQFGIKAIVDLRRETEYASAEGGRVLDRAYKPCTLTEGKIEDRKPLEREDRQDSSTNRGKRYLVSMLTDDLMKENWRRVNFFLRYGSLVLLVVDKLFGTHLFMKLFCHLTLNQHTVSEYYIDMLRHAKPKVANILRLLLDESNLPVLINCAAGKDRTGVVVALILACLEVEDDVIVADYALSEAELTPMKRRLYSVVVGTYGLHERFAETAPESMQEFLAEIAKIYGSVSGYLSSAGFTVEEQQALKKVFLETEQND